MYRCDAKCRRWCHFHCVGITSKPSNKWVCKRSDCKSAATANKQQEPDSTPAVKKTPPFVQFGSPPGVTSPKKKTPPMWE